MQQLLEKPEVKETDSSKRMLHGFDVQEKAEAEALGIMPVAFCGYVPKKGSRRCTPEEKATLPKCAICLEVSKLRIELNRL